MPVRAPVFSRALRLVAGFLVALFLQTVAAFGHASLNASEPEDGSLVDIAPARFVLTFSEPVAPLTLKLVRPDGSTIPLEDFALKDRTLEIEAPADIGRGTHVLSWRVVSADGHPIGGSVVFSVGEVSAQAPLVDDASDPAVRFWLWFAKVALYVGLFVGAGGVFARAILLGGIEAGGRIIAAALLAGAAGAVLSLGLQGADALGTSLSGLGQQIVWRTGFSTSYGGTVVAALAAFIVSAAALAVPRFAASVAAVAALVGTGTALALSGHASAASPQWLMRPAVFLHAVAIAAWIGALAPLVLALFRSEAGAPQALRRFSRDIPAFVALLIVTGCVLAIVQMGRASALADTDYGRVFAIKLCLLTFLFALAAHNRWQLTAPAQAGEPEATRSLVRSVAHETALALAIFGAVALWRFTPPPRALDAAAAEPVIEYIQSDKAQAHIQVMPGRAGTVVVSVNVLTGDFELLDAKEVTLVLSSPDAGIEPFRRKLTRRGEANWRADDLAIPLPGLWRVRVDILVTDFELLKLEGQIRIR